MRKTTKRVWILCVLAFCLTLLTGLIACTKSDSDDGIERANTYEISLNRKTCSLFIGEDYTLTATVKKNKEVVENAVVVWTTSAPEIVTVENGKVTAVQVGESVITATYNNDYVARCSVVVEYEYAEELRVSVTPNTVNLLLPKEGEGDEITLQAKLSLGGEEITSGYQFAWVSQNPAVATVENGRIKAVSAGQTTVRLTAVYGGNTAYCDCAVEVENEKTPTVLNGDYFFDLSKGEPVAVSFSFGTVTKACLPSGEEVAFSQKGDVVYLDLANSAVRGKASVYLETDEYSVKTSVVVADGVISTSAGFLALNNATAGSYYALSANITLSADDWTSANGFYLLNKFNATLDGNGFKVSTTFTKEEYYERGIDGNRVDFIKEIGVGASIENVYFDLDIFMPNQSCVFIQNFLASATIKNCIFDLSLTSAGSGWKGTLANRALIGTFSGSMENVIVIFQDEILRLMKDGSPANGRIGAMKNCVFVNVNNSKSMGFEVTLDTDTGYVLTLQTMKDVWAYKTLADAVSGTFSTTDGKTGYYAGDSNVDADGFAVVSTQEEHAKTLAEIFADTPIGVNASGKLTLCGKVCE